MEINKKSTKYGIYFISVCLLFSTMIFCTFMIIYFSVYSNNEYGSTCLMCNCEVIQQDQLICNEDNKCGKNVMVECGIFINTVVSYDKETTSKKNFECCFDHIDGFRMYQNFDTTIEILVIMFVISCFIFVIVFTFGKKCLFSKSIGVNVITPIDAHIVEDNNNNNNNLESKYGKV